MSSPHEKREESMDMRYLNPTQGLDPFSDTLLAAHEPLAGIRDSDLPAAAVLPESFYGSPGGAVHARSEVALMCAVLDDAIECVQKQLVSNRRCDRRLAAEAEAWFFDNDERWPFSFVRVCQALGLDPEYLRRGLRRWRQQPPVVLQKRQGRTMSARRVKIAA
jgi:hypothetical protein